MTMHYRWTFFVLLALTSVAAAADSPPAPARAFSLDRLYSLPWITGTRPKDPVWSPDSRSVAFLWNDEGTNFLDVWMTDVASAKPVRLTTMPRPESPTNPGVDVAKLEQVARAEKDQGVSDVIWAPDGRRIIFSFHGRLYQVSRGQSPAPLTEEQARAGNPAASRNAGAIAYLSGGALWTLDPGVARPVAKKIYAPDRADVYVESFEWAGDANRIAFVEADASAVPKRGIPDYLGPETRLVEVKRPFPGEPSESRRLGVVTATGGDVRWQHVSDNPLDQIHRVVWSPDARSLLVDTSDLYIKDRRLLIVDPASGQSRVLVRDADPHNVTAEWWCDWAPDGHGIYFTSDRGTDYQVYYAGLAGGEPKALDTGAGAVFDVTLSSAARALFVVTNADKPELRRVVRVPLSSGKPKLVTSIEGAHRAVPSPDGKNLADVYSSDVTPPDLYLQDTASARTRRVTHSPLPEFDDYRWVAPTYVTFPNVNDGTLLHARLTLPPNFDPAKTWPAIIGSVYSNTAHNEWGGRIYHPTWGLDQYLAQQGYVIMNVDISGSSGYGKAFRQRIREDYGGVDVDDLYSGVKYLTSQMRVDPERVGIWGSSYGGLLTATSMFRYPGIYRAGIAGAPATSLFHALTGEMQTMMAPQDHQAQYAKSSAFLRSGGLEGHLMIVHGMRDEVVLFKDSVTLEQRLILQGKDIDLLALPDAPHGWDTEGLAQTRYAFRKMVEYFDRYLGVRE